MSKRKLIEVNSDFAKWLKYHYIQYAITDIGTNGNTEYQLRVKEEALMTMITEWVMFKEWQLVIKHYPDFAQSIHEHLTMASLKENNESANRKS